MKKPVGENEKKTSENFREMFQGVCVSQDFQGVMYRMCSVHKLPDASLL